MRLCNDVFEPSGLILTVVHCCQDQQAQGPVGRSLREQNQASFLRSIPYFHFDYHTRFAVEIVKRTREAVGKDFIIIFRISLIDLVEGGSNWAEVCLLCNELSLM